MLAEKASPSQKRLATGCGGPGGGRGLPQVVFPNSHSLPTCLLCPCPSSSAPPNSYHLPCPALSPSSGKLRTPSTSGSILRAVQPGALSPSAGMPQKSTKEIRWGQRTHGGFRSSPLRAVHCILLCTSVPTSPPSRTLTALGYPSPAQSSVLYYNHSWWHAGPVSPLGPSLPLLTSVPKAFRRPGTEQALSRRSNAGRVHKTGSKGSVTYSLPQRAQHALPLLTSHGLLDSGQESSALI